jgi:hypothetical protein
LDFRLSRAQGHGAGATADAQDKNERTPLCAAGGGKDEVTFLSIAAQEGHTDTVLALLEAGATVDAKDKSGSTALDMAKHQQHAEMAAILRAAGARE